MRGNERLWCHDCGALAAPACWGSGGDEHSGTTAYVDVAGVLWVVDPEGRHGWWSYEPGCGDARAQHSYMAASFEPRLHVSSHVHNAIRPGGGPTYRRYTRVGVDRELRAIADAEALRAANGPDWWERNESKMFAAFFSLAAGCVLALIWIGRGALATWWEVFK